MTPQLEVQLDDRAARHRIRTSLNESLLVEASAGKIGTAVDQLLLFCYHYDPATGKYGVVILNVIRAAGLATVLSIGALMFNMADLGVKGFYTGYQPNYSTTSITNGNWSSATTCSCLWAFYRQPHAIRLRCTPSRAASR